MALCSPAWCPGLEHGPAVWSLQLQAVCRCLSVRTCTGHLCPRGWVLPWGVRPPVEGLAHCGNHTPCPRVPWGLCSAVSSVAWAPV